MTDNIETKELNMEEKVTVKSIASWTTGFRRIESNGDVTIPPKGDIRLSRSEIISQVQNGNRLFTGIDDRGSHATLYIDDEATRRELDFDFLDDGNKVQKQLVLTVDAVKKMFELKTIKTFEKRLEELIVTKAEKGAVVDIIKKEKLNDFEKIRIVEEYTGYRVG